MYAAWALILDSEIEKQKSEQKLRNGWPWDNLWPTLGSTLWAPTWVLSICSLFSPLLGALFDGVCHGFTLERNRGLDADGIQGNTQWTQVDEVWAIYGYSQPHLQ
jgi:hypothetical protein